MKALVFDPFSGASGDMIVASLIDAGADRKRVLSAMESIEGVRVELRRVVKRGISALRLDVICEESHSRTLEDVIGELEKTDIDEEVREEAVKIFNILAEAEARVHGKSPGEIHFHEVGAKDAMADVVGAVAALKSLSPERIISTPIRTGGGFVEIHHGKYPVPAPATLEILRKSNLLFRGGPVEEELLTPTGAAILAHFVEKSENFIPPMKTRAIGYGAGSRDLKIPNVLRVISGELDSLLVEDEIVLLETNVDDITPEILGHFAEELMLSGMARDVSIIPALMKKGRSGHLVRVITGPEGAGEVSRKMVSELGTLGIRIIPVKHRLIALRRIERIEVKIGGRTHEVSVKVAEDSEGNILNISPEYEDCRKIHELSGIPLKDVMRIVEELAYQRVQRR
ncbi:MAG: pyridinium-3,5-bisthiocarboxylic acid mononucleotide nickel chelatase [Archaeoglobi archaeon]|nr:pyridinium-3,5-bisthiocarboxylic acid mononucleotide nickel chelatase [Archaeoglobi archaeon]MDK2781397.1 pyridinium-3,5-bisthiocarboxylic acid mononucleotide nickel chelatase [Archaeoglobi archaeon]